MLFFANRVVVLGSRVLDVSVEIPVALMNSAMVQTRGETRNCCNVVVSHLSVSLVSGAAE